MSESSDNFFIGLAHFSRLCKLKHLYFVTTYTINSFPDYVKARPLDVASTLLLNSCAKKEVSTLR